MSAKKSPKTTWQLCTTCACQVINRDMWTHGTLCTAAQPFSLSPTSPPITPHTIVDGDRQVMMGALCRAPKNVVADVAAKFGGWRRANTIVLHNSTCDRLNLPHLQAVELNVKIGDRVITRKCTLFASTAVAQTSMFTCDSSIQLPTTSTDIVFATVSPLSVKSSPPITLSVSNISLARETAICTFLRAYLRGALITDGETVDVDYFGAALNVKITRDTNAIAEKMADLALNNDSTIYRIMSDTPIRINLTAPSTTTVTARRSSSSMAALIGMHNTVGSIEQYIVQPIIRHLHPSSDQSASPKLCVASVLLHGTSGTGKSLVLRTLHSTLRTLTNERALNVRTLTSRYDIEMVTQACVEGEVEDESRPMCLLVDDIAATITRSTSSTLSVTLGATADELMQSHDEANSSDWASFAQMLDSITQYKERVWLLATITSADSMPEFVRRRFDAELETSVPNDDERFLVLQSLLDPLATAPSTYHELLRSIADSAHGYTAADLTALVKQANTRMTNEDNYDSPNPALHHLQHALAHTRASAMREISLEVPRVLLSAIGGYEHVKQRLCQTVVWPLKNAEAFARLNVQPSSGVLLYGPPGCSKTLLARALATESGLNFLAVKGPELFSAYVGESEKAVRALFTRARHAAPAIVFFDEIDALAQTRGISTSSSSVGDRVVASLLTEMDGLEPLHGVAIIAATNRPDAIDRALMRPGRIDECIYVPLPDKEARMAILKTKIASMPVSKSLNIDNLVEATDGYSGAEIVGVCREAALGAMRNDMNVKELSDGDFTKALEVVRPHTDRSMLELYEEFERGAVV